MLCPQIRKARPDGLDTHSENCRQYLSTLLNFRSMILKTISEAAHLILAQWRGPYLYLLLVLPFSILKETPTSKWSGSIYALVPTEQHGDGPGGHCDSPACCRSGSLGERLWLVHRKSVGACMQSFILQTETPCPLNKKCSFSSLYPIFHWFLNFF